MKGKFLISVFAILLIASIIGMSSCDKVCKGEGTLSLKNSSLNTVHRIMVDGINYGSLDPGDHIDISLPAG
jgi:hypothetical protein